LSVSEIEPTVPPRSGLLNVVDIVVAPNAAFERLRIVPTWGWAFLVATLLSIAGMLLCIPAQMHAFDVSAPALLGAQTQNIDPAQREATLQRITSVSHLVLQLTWIAAPIFILIAALLQSVIMLIGNGIGKGQGTFAKFFALAITVAVVGSGLALLLAGVIAVVRGPNAYEVPAQVLGAIPGLALLAPGASPKLFGFLATINVVSVWATALLALGMIAIARVSRGVAWATALVMLLLTAAFSGAFAR
jgi:hypothetical protein